MVPVVHIAAVIVNRAIVRVLQAVLKNIYANGMKCGIMALINQRFQLQAIHVDGGYAPYEMTPCDRIRNRGCGICVNKTEQKLYGFLNSKFTDVLKEYKIDGFVTENNYQYRADFYLPSVKMIIELDGDQHFRNSGYMQKQESTMTSDIIKMKRYVSDGLSVIRLYQPHVLYDKYDWKSLLCELIRQYETPEVYFLHDGPLYDKHFNRYICGDEDTVKPENYDDLLAQYSLRKNIVKCAKDAYKRGHK